MPSASMAESAAMRSFMTPHWRDRRRILCRKRSAYRRPPAFYRVAVVVPVVFAFEIRKRHGHVRGVISIFVRPPGVGLCGCMKHLFPALLLGSYRAVRIITRKVMSYVKFSLKVRRSGFFQVLHSPQ